jgi:hypothetical protein
MSRYRIVAKSTFDYYGQRSVEYFPQYKLWGLIWIGISNELGFASTCLEDRARDSIEAHKARKEAKAGKVRIIEVE